MNQQEHGFCQACRSFVELGPLGGISEHPAASTTCRCHGSFHAPATLVHGPGWISWTLAANSYARSVLVDPPSPEVLQELDD